MRLPDLSAYRLHRTVVDAEFEGVPVPGLSAEFFRREEAGRLASAGRYRLRGRDLLLAWGYVDEEHCRFSAVRAADGCWSAPMPGCPQIRVIRAGARVTGLVVRDPDGQWIG